MALIINNLKKSTSFSAGTQLKADDLNDSFEQPIKITNAIAEAIAACDTDLDTVAETTISADTPDLEDIFAKALKSILSFKPSVSSLNYARMNFSANENNDPILTLESVIRSDTDTVVNKTSMTLTPTTIYVGDETNDKKIEINPTTSTITATNFIGTATKATMTNVSNDVDYNVLLGLNNEVHYNSDFTYNPNKKRLTLPQDTVIRFGSYSTIYYNLSFNAYYYSGTAEIAETVNLEEQTEDSDFPIVFNYENGKLAETQGVTVNPFTKTITADYFNGIASHTEKIKIQTTNSTIYLGGVLGTTSDSYYSMYVNSQVYIDSVGGLHAPSFYGEATSASKATNIAVTSTSSASTFYLTFTNSTNTTSGTVYANSNIKVKPSEGIIYATKFVGTATQAERLSSNKRIELTGALSGYTTTDFSDSAVIQARLASDYYPIVKQMNNSQMKGITLSVSINGVTKNLENFAWIMYAKAASGYGGAGPHLYCFIHKYAGDTHTTEFQSTDRYRFVLEYSNSKWYIKYRDLNSGYTSDYSQWGVADERFFTMVICPIKL